MRFSKFFSIDIGHNYFDRSLCNDLLIRPTAECSRLLRKYNMIFNNSQQANISVFAEVDDKGRLRAEPPADVSFDFFILLLNPDFLSYSKLPQKKDDEMYIFSSRNVDPKNQSLLIASPGKKIQKTIAGKGLLGLLQIFYEGTLPAAYALNFEAAEAKWKYYLLADNNTKNLAINASLAGASFSKNNQNDEDKIGEALNNNFPDANLLVFESQTPICYNKNGIKDIQLINVDKNSILINHLPNPCCKENGIKIINILN